MNADSLAMLKPAQALEDAFLVLDSVQHLPAHRQVAGVTLLFKLLAEGLRLDKSQLLDAADRMAHDADSHYFHHIHAVREYIAREHT